MKWLHSLFHWRCEREIARLDALVSAVMPRYQPVSSPPATIPERVERALAQAAQDDNVPEGMTTTRWPLRTIDWVNPDDKIGRVDS